MSDNPTIRMLEAFYAILLTGSATAAAERLGTTQPGVSRLLSAFEDHVGFKLFYREKSRLIPTDEALSMQKEVEQTLNSVERLGALAKNLYHSNSGSLKIVAPVSFMSGPLADVVADFMRSHPNVRVSLESRSPESARELVARRTVDCGFIQLPEHHPGIHSEPVIKGHLVCVLPPNHKLAKRKTLSAKDLNGEPLILLGKGRFSREQIEHAFRTDGVPARVKIETHTVATACAFAKRGLGIAIVNGLLAEQFRADATIVNFSPKITVSYGFITSAYTPMSRLTQAFFEHCKIHLG
ncbi:MAG: transcriptional regulator [Idiomarina sp.]|nr:transcriptional regulator [Idiomarina sp.]MCL5050996.1 LysR family transcriptional regulator [Bacillota bacterium]